ncbi:MAG: chain-length determining protein [Prevotella sp.]|jgi:uncharacterized protein involved in exopolysaccharide biosynthesis|nr:chain-length determining protein [Prevotella sp.]
MTDNREENEIDLLELGKKLWDNKRFIIKVCLIGMVIGLIVAFSIPKEYTTTVVLMPEAQSASGGTMGSLAALAGINLGNSAGTDVLASPDLYPSVFQSTPFLRGLLDIKVKDVEREIDTTLYVYMNEHQDIAWWSYILVVPKVIKGFLLPKDEIVGQESNNRFISEEESILLENLIKRITVSSDKKTYITSIGVTMQSPGISAFLADSLTSYFQSYIINYRTQKARNDLEYAEKLYNDSKNNYYKAQQQLAAFVDGNLNVVSAKYRTTQERLQNEASLAYSVYNQTAQQLQLAKVKVQDNTPVFTVIQPAMQSIDPSKPNKKLILIGFIFLAFVIAGCWVLRDDLKRMVIGNK